ncbi:MAG TPA: endonuclease III [Gemmatimonadales bacterium]
MRRTDGRAGRRTGGTKAAVRSEARTARLPARPPAQAQAVVKLLRREYPDAHCELNFRTPYELLVATILSAQCTDVRVNLVTPGLFERFPTAQVLAGANPDELEDMIRSTGFFRNKTKSLLGMAHALVETHGGEVPSSMEELRRLPGVGRKTANVVLGNAFGINQGITVDTHVARLSDLLQLSREADPLKIEQDLMAQVPRKDWTMFSHLLIWHGRRVCIARRPKCPECVLNRICPSARLDPAPARPAKRRIASS